MSPVISIKWIIIKNYMTVSAMSACGAETIKNLSETRVTSHFIYWGTLWKYLGFLEISWIKHLVGR